jgi:hypothetical protein
LLHRMRISPREVYALQRRVLDQSPNVPDWAVLALGEWSHNEVSHGQCNQQGSVENDSDNPSVSQIPPRPYPDAEPLGTT